MLLSTVLWMFQATLNEPGMSVLAQGGASLLHMAIKGGHPEMVTLLLKYQPQESVEAPDMVCG